MRCSHCGTNFRPKRSDAKYCSSPCREAAHRGRKKAADQASAAAEAEQRKVDALRVFDQLNAHQFIASMLHALARERGVDLKFMPAPTGVIAVEGRDGAFEEADTVFAEFPYISREAKISKDAANAVISSSKCIGGSVIAREAEEECRAAFARGGNVYELRPNPNYIAQRNRAASLRNDGARFLGLRGFRCGCGRSSAGRNGWTCCGEPFDTNTPDTPRGFPHPRQSIRYG